MNRQQIFDKVLTALITQKVASLDYTNACAYRGENGTKCAAGHLISDHYYRKSMEGIIIHSLRDNNFKLPKFITENIELIQQLQYVHDNYMSRYEVVTKQRFIEEMKKTAIENNLEFKEELI